MRIDQCLPDFAPHDAIGNHVLQVQRLLRSRGIESDIWADVIHRPVARHATAYRERPASRGADDLLLYHASTFSDMAGWLLERAGQGQRLLSDYHNITPGLYFARWAPTVAAGVDRARTELASLAPVTELALADSDYNRAELDAVGYPKTATAHLLLDLEEFHQPPDAAAVARIERKKGGGTRWLFVGRLAPNKCAHDVIGAFALYRKLYDPKATLSLAGSPTFDSYLGALHRLVGDLDLGDAVEFGGSMPFGELLAEFAAADALVCLSEHEGFCVPLIEAMELSVPVVAYAAAAVPDTVGDAALLLEDKDPLAVAVGVGELMVDASRLDALRKAGRARAETLSLPHTSKQFMALLEEHLR